MLARLWAFALVLGALLSVAPAPAGATHESPGTPIFARIDLPTRDMVFDPVSSKIYASVRADAGVLGNRVLEIDPHSGAVGRSVFVGSEPDTLALSDDGQFLYVELIEAAAVRRVHLPTMTAGLQFPIGEQSCCAFGVDWATVEDMEVQPGNPHTLAVSIEGRYGHSAVAIFDDGVRRPEVMPAGTGSHALEFGVSPARLYVHNTQSGFRRMEVTPSGLSQLTSDGGLISGTGVEIELDNDKIYSSSGELIDPEARTRLGTYAIGNEFWSAVEPDTPHGRVYFATANTLLEFEQGLFSSPLRTIPVPGLAGVPLELTRTGEGLFALQTRLDQIFLIRFQSGSDTTPPSITTPGDMTVLASGPGGTTVSYTVDINDLDGGASSNSCNPVSGSLFPVGQTKVFCSATDGAGNIATANFDVTVARPSPAVTYLGIEANDIVYNPFSRLIYASVPSSGGPLANRIVAIDPRTGAVGQSVLVGSEPKKLALSDDGRFLYVALDGASTVRRVSLPSLTPGLEFSIGSSVEGPYSVSDLAVPPGDPNAVAVARMSRSGNPYGVAIFRNGIKDTYDTSGLTGNAIEFGTSANLLFSLVVPWFYRMEVGSHGVTKIDEAGVPIGGVDFDLRNRIVYTTSGVIFHSDAGELLGRFPLEEQGPVEPNAVQGSVYFASTGRVSEFDHERMTLRQSFPLGGMSERPTSLIGIGEGADLALRTITGQVVLVRFQTTLDTTPPSIDVPDDITVEATTPEGAVVEYLASVVDDSGASWTATCDPSSGAVFPIGTTTVNCSAADASGNSAAASFRVSVLDAQAQIARLRTELRTLPNRELARNLDSTLRIAAGALASRPARACSQLASFSRLVARRAGRGIVRAAATSWVVDSERIRAVIACR